MRILRRWLPAACLSLGLAYGVVVIDRIAVQVENGIVKDSDIRRSLRIAEFLNGKPPRITESERREAAQRLIDQAFIKQEVQLGDYPQATWQEADKQIAQVKKDRFKAPSSFDQALKRYELVEPDLRFEFQWQLTVLRFIDLRFKPAVLITDQDIQKYYDAHAVALRNANPGKGSLDDLHDQIHDILAGEEVNKQFFAWLDEQRKSKKIIYREEGLQ